MQYRHKLRRTDTNLLSDTANSSTAQNTTCYSKMKRYRRLHLCKQNCKQNNPATTTTAAAVKKTLALTFSGRLWFSKHLFQLRVRALRCQAACAFLRPQESF